MAALVVTGPGSLVCRRKWPGMSGTDNLIDLAIRSFVVEVMNFPALRIPTVALTIIAEITSTHLLSP